MTKKSQWLNSIDHDRQKTYNLKIKQDLKSNQKLFSDFDSGQRNNKISKSNSYQRAELGKYLGTNVEFKGQLCEVRISKWRKMKRYVEILLKPVYISGKKINHIWLQVNIKFIKELEPYLYQSQIKDAKYDVYKPDYLIDIQKPKQVKGIEMLDIGNSTLSMYEVEQMDHSVIYPDTLIHAYTISGKAKVVKYRRNPKNSLVQKNINDGFTFDYGINPDYNSLAISVKTEKKYLYDGVKARMKHENIHIPNKVLRRLVLEEINKRINRITKCLHGHRKEDYINYKKYLKKEKLEKVS